MPSASGEQEEVALSLYEEAEEDLIRLTLQEEDRFVYDEMNTGHKMPQSPRDLIRMTWIRGTMKHSRRSRGHSHCKS